MFIDFAANACLQLRRAISIHADGKNYLRSMLSRRQLQGFVGRVLNAQSYLTLSGTRITIAS